MTNTGAPVLSWSLHFHVERPPPFVRLCDAVSRPFGATPTTRDGYGRTITLRVEASSLALSMSIVQQVLAIDESAPLMLEHFSVNLEAPNLSFSERLAAWEALRTSLGTYGYADETLAFHPASIVDDAAVASPALAAVLRSRITSALVDRVPAYRHVALVSTRPDDMNRVLEAYLRPQEIVSVCFYDCQLQGLPAALARFENVRSFSLEWEHLFDAERRGPQRLSHAFAHVRQPNASCRRSGVASAYDDARGHHSGDVMIIQACFAPLCDESRLHVERSRPERRHSCLLQSQR